jgi:NhaP-type Na+/H+ or K+/H+ antiporter
MEIGLLIGLVSIIALGVSAQWLAWRLKLPAILLLLVFGIVAGPIANILNPDQLFGNVLGPIVSISVAIILFEGGLTLRLSDLKDIGSTVGKLISIGVIITWCLTARFRTLRSVGCDTHRNRSNGDHPIVATRSTDRKSRIHFEVGRYHD